MTALSFVAYLFRKSPRFRGHFRAARYINQLALRLGADPLATTSLWDGTVFRIDLRSATEFYAYYTGEYDRDLIHACIALHDPQRSFLDVGGNVGFYAIAIGRSLRNSRAGGNVISFEPHPANYKRICDNIELNSLKDVVAAFDCGLSEVDETLELVMREDFVQGSSTGNASVRCSETFDAGFASVAIQVRPLDKIVSELPIRQSIDFIKVDIEGHEDFFLKGARGTIASMRPVVLTEVNPG